MSLSVAISARRSFATTGTGCTTWSESNTTGNAVTGKGNIQVSLKHGRLVGLHVCEYLRGQPALTPTKVAAIEAKAKALQEMVGYSGNYKEWIAKPRPERVEGVAPVI